jgi:hypothetical protein
LKWAYGLEEIIVNFHLFHNVDGGAGGHLQHAGEIAVLRLDKDETGHPHVVHGPGRSPDILGDLGLYKNNRNVFKHLLDFSFTASKSG